MKNKYPFYQKLALVAEIADGGTFLVMFLIEFLFSPETLWDSNIQRYLIPALPPALQR